MNLLIVSYIKNDRIVLFEVKKGCIMDGKLVYGRPGDEYYFDPYEEVWPLYNWSFVSDKQGGLLVKGRANELFTRPGKSVQMKVLSLSIEKERFVVKGKDRIYGLDYKTHDVVTRDLDNILPTLRVLLKNSPEAFTYIKELLPKIKKYTHNRELNRRKEICRMIPAESENAILFSFVGGEYVYADGIFIKTGNEYRYVSFKYDKCSKADPLYLKDK